MLSSVYIDADIRFLISRMLRLTVAGDMPSVMLICTML
nr:MAG TPA: hypothetical protein [Caudoviricetes sp.]